MGVEPNNSSTGKLWQQGIKHPEIKEYMVGTAQQMTTTWSTRVYGRFRKGGHYLEDTNNNARIAFNPPPGVPREYYIPDLGAKLAIIGGSQNSYVIANLDGAFTKYYEA